LNNYRRCSSVKYLSFYHFYATSGAGSADLAGVRPGARLNCGPLDGRL